MPKYINGERLDPAKQRIMRQEARTVQMEKPYTHTVQSRDKNGVIVRERQEATKTVLVQVSDVPKKLRQGFTLVNKGDDKVMAVLQNKKIAQGPDAIITEAVVRDIKLTTDLDVLAQGKANIARQVFDAVRASEMGESGQIETQKDLKSEVAKTDLAAHTSSKTEHNDQKSKK